MRYQTLMHDLLFKETFADPHNRRQLEFFLEQILGYETGYLHNKLDVSYESPIKKNKLKDKSIRGDIIIKFEDVVVNMEAYTLCEASHKVNYEKKKIMRSYNLCPWFYGIFLKFYFS